MSFPPLHLQIKVYEIILTEPLNNMGLRHNTLVIKQKLTFFAFFYTASVKLMGQNSFLGPGGIKVG